MKIDQQYLKDLLIAFEDNPDPQTNIYELKETGFDYNTDKFIFHMRILYDQSLIAQTDGEYGFGLLQSIDGSCCWSVVPLRLTSKGHDFISALRQKEVWNSVKNNFSDASASMLIDIAKQLAKGFAMKKIKDITGFDPE